jgi:putative nucleotidyltransferase with HDIG domain
VKIRRFRLTFLAKFGLVTSVLAVILSFSMSAYLISRHRAGMQLDESITAAGQVSAILTQPLSDFTAAGKKRGLPALRVATEATLQMNNVAGVVIYGSDGRAIYPSSAPARLADVRKTLKLSDLWISHSGSVAGASTVEFVPLLVNNAAYVVAIQLYDVATNAQMRSESRDVIEATVAALSILLFSLGLLAAGASREIERRRRQSEQTFSETLGVLAETIDCRDPYTAGHSRRVADYSLVMAKRLGLSSQEQNTIESSALLHDIGKIGIPDAVLLKPDRLDDDEFAIMREHPKIGAEILARIASMEDVTRCVLHHHERFDGRGYPGGLSGDDIPFGSRIICVADAFDAMTTDRPYRRGLSVAVATATLREGAGSQFDRRCVVTFLELVAEGAIAPPMVQPGAVPQFGQRKRVNPTLQRVG